MQKNIKYVSIRYVFFQALHAQIRLVFGRGSAPDPAVELTTLPRLEVVSPHNLPLDAKLDS